MGSYNLPFLSYIWNFKQEIYMHFFFFVYIFLKVNEFFLFYKLSPPAPPIYSLFSLFNGNSNCLWRHLIDLQYSKTNPENGISFIYYNFSAVADKKSYLKAQGKETYKLWMQYCSLSHPLEASKMHSGSIIQTF